ncbi:MAG: aminopeptidase P family protein [Acidobacteria bacterium]|nr:aminopeptidase P family protein [Acidobacteriota bacterium]
MYKAKTAQAVEILKELDIDIWFTLVRETKVTYDPSLDFLYPSSLTWLSALIISNDGNNTAIVGNLDEAAVKESGIFKEVISYKEGAKKVILDYLEKRNPKKIAINFSKDTEIADGLTHGLYLLLLEYLDGTPFKDRLVQSEQIIAALRGRKIKKELEILRKATKITAEIFDEVTAFVKPGLSEKDVAKFMLEQVEKRGLTTAWDPEGCPSVFTGPETAGAHFGPTDRKIERGHIMNIDFGVRVDGYVSDMQRTWYILREGETDAPEEVKRGFTVLRDSIRHASDAVKPGLEGKDIDMVSRKYITDNGYEEFPHALGHQLGREAHDGAGLFCPEWERYGGRPYLKIEIGQVYTIEPRLFVENHGTVTMEEEIVVTENGCEYLTEPQDELWLIK